MALTLNDGVPSPQPPAVARSVNSRPGSARTHRSVSTPPPGVQRPASASSQRVHCESSLSKQSTVDAQCKKSGRPAFMGGKKVPTTWCRSWGQRALEEELKPLPLTAVPVHMATPLEAQLAEALGIGDMQHWRRLPLEVGSCEQGSRCCWRWLARAALEQVAGTSMSHLSLPEAIAHLREETLDLAEQRKWRESAETELEQGAKDRYECDRLSTKLQDCQRDLDELRTAQAGAAQVRVDLGEQFEKNERLSAAQRNLQAEIVVLKAKHQILTEGDLLAAKNRAEAAENEIHKIVQSKVEHKVLNDDLNRQLLGLKQEIGTLKQQNVLLQRKQEDVSVRKKRRRKRGKAAAPSFR